MNASIILAPLVPMPVIWIAAGLMTCGLVLAIWRGLNGWIFRMVAALVLLAGIANPSVQREDRIALSDIVIALVDDSASQTLSDRAEQTETALRNLQSEVTQRPNTELRIVRVPDADGDGGTRLMTALGEAIAEEPSARIAGIVLLTDGRVHDMDAAPNLPAPMHVLLSGHDTDWDRRLIVQNAPAFAILGEPVTLTLRIEDQGAAPTETQLVDLSISIDGAPPLEFQIPVNEDLELPVTLPHGGMNVLQFQTPTAEGELTDRNNAAVVQINGVRDRLRVLLVSGEPHPGERTWRNLLKSDASVDLVHFTILRPPEKQDGVPVDELSLIAFPTRELFLEKTDEFDLIIFDRYKRRGILPSSYLENIRGYVERGGAVLIAAGPDFAGADSLFRSPLGNVLPAGPTARIMEQGFTPTLTELGHRHPVTSGLDTLLPMGPDGQPGWGRWLRQVEVVAAQDASVVMSGIDDSPLLILNRVGEGRVALLGSDHVWLWNRGYEGGGPQLELLRRLAHWMMKEPELEEETLWAEPTGQSMRIIRRTLADTAEDIIVQNPDGSETSVALRETSPGRFEATYDGPEMGLYRLADTDQSAVIALGPAAPREFVQTIATGDDLTPLADTFRGAVAQMDDGNLDVRAIREGRPASGRGWIGIIPRDAYRSADITVFPALPSWAFLLLSALLVIGAWLYEGRRR
ncbi:hypothetical protein [Aestuariibius sp. HNIBRBA575]|uniref:hypothetical protein n=1 Tax=Aestuariibius sp. HNIBRBA575 TaxID=3233343 RepID=UPI0034A1BEB3